MIIAWTLFVIVTVLAFGALLAVIDECNNDNIKEAGHYGMILIGLTIIDAIIAQAMWG